MGRSKIHPQKKKAQIEKWKHIKGYGNLYSVSNTGKVRRNKIIRVNPDGKNKQYTIRNRGQVAVIMNASIVC